MCDHRGYVILGLIALGVILAGVSAIIGGGIALFNWIF